MGLLFLLFILLISIFRLFDTGPGGQLISDGLVFAGLLALPLLLRRRWQGAEFLRSRGREKSAPAKAATPLPREGEPLRTQGLTRALLVWVTADARRLPATAVEASVAFLRSRGKLIAVGAPAFGELLIKTPGGYVTEQQYGDVVYDMLSARPIPLNDS